MAVHPDNLEAVQIFLACKIERIIAPSGHVIYEGVRRETIQPVYILLGLGDKVSPSTFLIFRTFENLVLKMLNKK